MRPEGAECQFLLVQVADRALAVPRGGERGQADMSLAVGVLGKELFVLGHMIRTSV